MDAAIHFATCEPRWLEHIGLAFLCKRWMQICPATRGVLNEHGCWMMLGISPDALSIHRRTDVMIMFTCALSGWALRVTMCCMSGF